MTEIEKQKCYKVMQEGIRNGKEAHEIFRRTNYTREQELFAFEKQGYAQGINQTLACIGYNHPDMKILGDLI